MNDQLLQKMIQIIDQDLHEVDHQLKWLERIQEKKGDLLIEQLELMRARREIEQSLEDLQNDKENKEKRKGKIIIQKD